MKPRTEGELLAKVERVLDGEAYDPTEMAEGFAELKLDPKRQLRRVHALLAMLPWSECPFLTSQGRNIYPFRMTAADVHVGDVAASLSRICRFNGHILAPGRIYSVAEHSVRGARRLRERGAAPLLQLAFLMHDGSEAYWGDIVRPIKKHPIFLLLEPYMERTQECIHEAVGLPPRAHLLDEVVKMDDLLAMTECRDITAVGDIKGREALFTHLQEPDGTVITPWEIAETEEAFLSLFHELLAALDRNVMPPA